MNTMPPSPYRARDRSGLLLVAVALAAVGRMAVVTRAHVALTFPEARFPPLDFLDSARTTGLCGVPRSSKSPVTEFRIGVPYNVTWRMQYPHQGGYRIQLFDARGTVVEQLAPGDLPPDLLAATGGGKGEAFGGVDDQTAEFTTIHFTRACRENCTLRLERQALEWGRAYRFRSCAEVRIVDDADSTAADECFAHGDPSSSTANDVCKCRRNYSGDRCQYKDDCTEDADCNNDGRCVPNGIVSNWRSCFCAYGFFGKNCEKRSAAEGAEDDCFAYDRPLPDRDDYAYGMFKRDCFKRLALGDAGSAGESSDFIYSRVVKNQLELIMDFETRSWLSVGWRPVDIPTNCRLFPDLAATSLLTDGGTNESVKNAGYLESALQAPLHPMDCVDVVMASVVGDSDNSGDAFLHIEDMYTRDRSTPLNDAFFDGEDSLVAAYARRQPTLNRTVVMFRRMIREIEPTDHPLGPGEIFLIHAKGQADGRYHHLAKSAFEKGTVRNANFYRDGQWKYHGGRNRGARRAEFITAAELGRSAPGPLRHVSPQPEVATLDESIFSTDVPKLTGGANTVPKSEFSNPQPEPEPEPVQKFNTNSAIESNAIPEPNAEPTAGPEPEPGPKAVTNTESSATAIFTTQRNILVIVVAHLLITAIIPPFSSMF